MEEDMFFKSKIGIDGIGMRQNGNILAGVIVMFIAIAAVVFLTSGSLPSTFIPQIGPDIAEPSIQEKTSEKTFQIPQTIIQKSGIAREYLTNPKEIFLKYVVNSEKGNVRMTVYEGLDNYLEEQPRSIKYYNTPPTAKDFIVKDLDDSIQKKELLPLVEGIQQITPEKEDQARIAISLVQNIPYDFETARSNELTGKYPYEVLYSVLGLCQEKSELLVFLLRELGFGAAILNYPSVKHMAVGVKCPMEISYQQSGYCFIETTNPSIPTDSRQTYADIGILPPVEEIIPISDGLSMNSISEEFNDAQSYRKILSNGPELDQEEYNQYITISEKYGLETN